MRTKEYQLYQAFENSKFEHALKLANNKSLNWRVIFDDSTFIISALNAQNYIIPLMRKAIEGGCDINFKNRNNLTALGMACADGLNPIVEFLLSKSADIFLGKESGNCLAWVFHNHHPETVKLIYSFCKKEEDIALLTQDAVEFIKTSKIFQGNIEELYQLKENALFKINIETDLTEKTTKLIRKEKFNHCY